MLEAAPPTLRERTYQLAARFVGAGTRVDGSVRLEALDIGSLDLMEMGHVLSEEYGLDVDPRDFASVETVDDVVAVLESCEALP
jgi:acyl carrier protein